MRIQTALLAEHAGYGVALCAILGVEGKIGVGAALDKGCDHEVVAFDLAAHLLAFYRHLLIFLP